jgi:replicative DNA helicase
MNIEDNLLGCIIADAPKYLDDLQDILKPEYFSTARNRDLWKAIEVLRSDSKPVNLLSLSEYCLKESLDVQAYEIAVLTDLKKHLYLDEAIYGAELIRETALKRIFDEKAREVSGKLMAGEIELEDAITEQEKTLNDLINDSVNAEYTTLADSIKDVIKDIDARGKQVGYSGVPSGFQNLDKYTDGWQGGQLIIWGGRPAMGKTTSALQMAINMTKQGKKVLVFTLEMKDTALVKKVISAEAEVYHHAIKTGNLSSQEWEQINASLSELLKNDRLMINKNFSININTLRATIKKVKKTKGLDCVIIDYLQLIQGSNRYKGNRVLEVGEISRILKKTALEEDIPVIALSQLSRATEGRAGGVPMLSDLRETGDIEQDADIVVFNYRPEYYDIEQLEDGTPTAGLFQLVVAKNREGEVGTLDLYCDLGKSRVWYADNTLEDIF